MIYRELQLVEARAAVPGTTVRAGDLGTVVMVHTKPRLAYEVEFVGNDGQTIAMLALLPGQIRAHSQDRQAA